MREVEMLCVCASVWGGGYGVEGITARTKNRVYKYKNFNDQNMN